MQIASFHPKITKNRSPGTRFGSQNGPEFTPESPKISKMGLESKFWRTRFLIFWGVAKRSFFWADGFRPGVYVGMRAAGGKGRVGHLYYFLHPRTDTKLTIPESADEIFHLAELNRTIMTPKISSKSKMNRNKQK